MIHESLTFLNSFLFRFVDILTSVSLKSPWKGINHEMWVVVSETLIVKCGHSYGRSDVYFKTTQMGIFFFGNFYSIDKQGNKTEWKRNNLKSKSEGEGGWVLFYAPSNHTFLCCRHAESFFVGYNHTFLHRRRCDQYLYDDDANDSRRCSYPERPNKSSSCWWSFPNESTILPANISVIVCTASMKF